MPIRSALLLLAVLAAPPLRAQPATDPSGTWLTEDRRAQIRIAPCGNDRCGTIAQVTEPVDPATKAPRTDVNNPDPALRTRPILGLPLLRTSPAPNGTWTGTIYNAEDGHTYTVTLTRRDTTLRVQGCALYGLLCGSQSWTPVPAAN